MAPAAAIAIATGSPVAFASTTGPDGMPIGVVYHGSPVKNAQEVRARGRWEAYRQGYGGVPCSAGVVLCHQSLAEAP